MLQVELSVQQRNTLTDDPESKVFDHKEAEGILWNAVLAKIDREQPTDVYAFIAAQAAANKTADASDENGPMCCIACTWGWNSCKSWGHSNCGSWNALGYPRNKYRKDSAVCGERNQRQSCR